MYAYYVLRGTQQGQKAEIDGEITTESFPGIELDDGPVIITTLLQQLHNDGILGEWDACDLTHAFFERDDTYLLAKDRWIRRSEIAIQDL